jgi:hypothetical protein
VLAVLCSTVAAVAETVASAAAAARKVAPKGMDESVLLTVLVDVEVDVDVSVATLVGSTVLDFHLRATVVFLAALVAAVRLRVTMDWIIMVDEWFFGFLVGCLVVWFTIK